MVIFAASIAEARSKRSAAAARAVAHFAGGLFLGVGGVGEKDDVLDARGDIAQLLEGLGERRVDVDAAAARGDAQDLLLRRALRA